MAFFQKAKPGACGLFGSPPEKVESCRLQRRTLQRVSFNSDHIGARGLLRLRRHGRKPPIPDSEPQLPSSTFSPFGWDEFPLHIHRRKKKPLFFTRFLRNLQEPMCLCVGTVIHELGHALGMNHEQSRPDRDQYVTVHWNNVRPGKEPRLPSGSFLSVSIKAPLNECCLFCATSRAREPGASSPYFSVY